MVLPQSQRTASSRSGAWSGKLRNRNSSAVSLTSSSNEGYDAAASRGTSMHNSHNGLSRRHQPSQAVSENSTERARTSTTDESSDAEYSRSSIFGRQRGSSVSKKQTVSHDSSFTKAGTASTKSGSSGVGTLRGLGRRLFNRSSSNLKPAALLTSRSHSASSDSTQAQSPPLTPTTPPLIQPVWLPNGQKDFFANLSSLPSGFHGSSQPITDLHASSGITTDISPKTRQEAFTDQRHSYDYSRETIFDDTSSNGHGVSNTFSHTYSLLSTSSAPSATAALPTLNSSIARREIPAVIEEESDSDFLRAVLNFGDGEDALSQSPSYRGGRAAPLPSRSSSLGQISGIASSPSYANPFSTARPPLHRTPDGRMVLTQAAAKDFASEKQTPGYVLVQRKYRRGLFGNESESEDEYGDDEDLGDDETTMTTPSSRATSATAQQLSQREKSNRFPSSFAKSSSRAQSPSNDSSTHSPRPPGLDSAAKKALYNCTLLKVHMHLAPTLAGDAEARTLIPVIATGEVLYNNEDLKFPRSINGASRLHKHTSTHGFVRNLHVALARTSVMRKLRRERLSIEQEVEISWFQRRYGSASIPAEHISKALSQRQMVSPEALAKPPIAAASHDLNAAPLKSTTSNRRLSGTVGAEAGQKNDKTGIVVWAQRPSFLERTVELLPADEFAPGEVLYSGAKLALHSGAASSASPTSTISYSPRIRVLADLPSIHEERRIKYQLAQKPRRASRLASASDGTVMEGSDCRTSSATRSARGSPLASPSSKQKRLPPWMAPRNPHLLSPRSMSHLHSSRSASEGLTAFSTLHQNSSTSSIPRVRETEEPGADSSDEEVPLANLQTFRAQRSAEKERIQKLENEIALLRLREGERDKDEEERKAREEEARRIEAERVYEERKAALEARRMEKNRRSLQEARERRGFTRQSVLLAEPNYGAGNPLLSPIHRSKPDSSPSSPNLAASHEPMSPGASRAIQHGAAMSKLQGNRGSLRSSSNLYAQQEGQRRSKTSVVAAASSIIEHTAPAMTSPRMQSSVTAVSPLVELHRNSSMASLTATAAQHSLSQRRSMVALSTSPQITQRRTSLNPLPLGHFQEGAMQSHPAQSMQHLSPHLPNLHHTTSLFQLSPALAEPSRTMLPNNPTSNLLSSQPYLTDPRLSMSTTDLRAHAHLLSSTDLRAHAHLHQAHAQAYVAQPFMAQTAKVSSRMRPRMPAPLVSLYGDVVPSSALSSQQANRR